MEVLSCSDVQYVGESSCTQQSPETTFLCGEAKCLEQGKQVKAIESTHKVDDFVLDEEGPHKDRSGEDQGRVEGPPISEAVSSRASYCELRDEGQKPSCNFHGFEHGNLNAQKQGTETCTASQNTHLTVDTAEVELPSKSWEKKSCLQEAECQKQHESVALWVKWRGKWHAGIRCARADCPLSTLKAKPTHDGKKYIVVFSPQTGNFYWEDILLVRSIHELPQPIAYRTHYIGVEMVKDLTIPRRFLMQKLAVDMLNINDQLHIEAVTESARKVMVWKDFAMEASLCKCYSDLGMMLRKLQNMILQRYINPDWLEHSFDSWTQHCQNAQSAESIERLMEELVDSILWIEVKALRDAPVQPELGSEWKTWKQEVMKWFSMSHPISIVGDAEQWDSDGSATMGLQMSRKRPKLEVRRAEMHTSPVENRDLHDVHPQATTIEIDSGFFNSQGLENAGTLESETCEKESFTEGAASTECLGSVADRWDGIVVEAGNPEFIRTTDMEEAPVDGGDGGKTLDPGNRYRQCLAFIEAKGRQCGRWANDGDVYCCVHLATRSLGKASRVEQTPPTDVPMCEGTTTNGTRCKHRSRYGSSFCKKHTLQSSQHLMDIEKPSSSSGNKLKSKHEENISRSEAAYCKEIMLVGEVQNPVQENAVSAMEGETFNGENSLIEKYEHSTKGNNSTELLRCIGFCHQSNSDPCLDHPKLHSLYCEKHLPSWLKRARNGRSRIISKEVFIDLLRNCSSQEKKLHLHRACELLYGLIKGILSRRNLVPREVQLQRVLSEASKDFSVGECLMKLVSCEKEKLRRLWGLDAIKTVSPSGTEKPVLMPGAHKSDHDIEKNMKCKICAKEFSDDQVLRTHWMEVHKKEAQWLFRGYACAICMNSFTNKKVLESHVMERHGVQFLEQCILFQCMPCGSHFVNPEQLWVHVLSVHSADFRLPSVDQQHDMSAGQASPKLELGNINSAKNNSESQIASRRFICRFCGLKFDLLPDLGRHHQAAHMGPSSIGHCPPKRGIRFYAYKLKSGRLSHPRFKKGLGAVSYRIRNRGSSSMKKRIQASSSVSTGEVRLQSQATEAAGLGSLVESQCSSVANILFSEIQKAKSRPDNLDIISIARSTCCKGSLQATLEGKYGVLPERLYLKAAKLCSELNIQVEWHQEGFICPKGCKPVTDPQLLSPLTPFPSGFVEPLSAKLEDPVNEEWETDECHYIIYSQHIEPKPMRKTKVLCEDISLGQESVPVACAVDEDLMGSLHILADEGSDLQNTRRSMPWEGFTYVTKRLLDPSLGLDTESSQLGCACPHSTCYPDTCDHVYLFDNDYEDAKDIYGKTMHGRFPYDEKGRIILEKGYPVYECNSMCSCDRTCRNRVSQNGVQVKLEIFKTEKKGWAVRAGEAITHGTFVCEYIGEVLNDEEANKRSKRYDNDGCSYLYDIDTRIDEMSGLTEGAVPYVIDATKHGNVSRFINHSCLPSLVSHQVVVESMDCQLAHIALYANRDIALGEELTYNYNYKLRPGEGRPCHCGTSGCRGRLY
ncbi:hypothetical protein HHK36_030844 [Tetracentron sinense]|uniref:Histone-lysine N-methyltransferase SUVR5 n=1 Tax=Tetracentron sinense TaxID=13715 RepID=A0A834Y8I8_TETSI|nr:hypothetical protein HHK36_030844 [Tetracentron sinense]